jgi:hypothetical protein
MENHVGNLLKIHMLYWPSQAVLTAVELDLFTTLGDQCLTAKKLSEKLGITQRCSYDFFDALVALRFLKRVGNGKEASYCNFDGMAKMLDKKHGFMIEGYKSWSNLRKALETGKSLNCDENTDAEADEIYAASYYSNKDRLREFHNAMDSIQEENFLRLVNAFDFSQYKTMLDIGAGSCLLSKIINKSNPELMIRNFDLPSALPERNNDINNISYLEGDVFKDILPPSDVITMGNVLHNWGLDKKKFLIKKAYETLTSNGVLIIIENIIDDLRRVNAHSLLMSLNMLIEFGEGSGFTAYEFKEWAEEIGFQDFKIIQLAGQASAILAYKQRNSQN